MPLVLDTPPATTPVTLAQAKAHLKVDDAAEDALIADLIAAATRRIEAVCALAFITQGWRLLSDCWPRKGVVRIPLYPLQAVQSVKVLTETGLQTVDPAAWEADTIGRPARLRALAAFPAPADRMNVYEIAFTAGFGDAPADVPADLKQAVLLTVAHWFEHREGRDAPGLKGLPAEARAIVRDWREVRV
ncbi:MAG TPA: hypothetical protein ENK15_09410 [Thermopetrobacter sp.]|nr:hypothetical protein [Thermopetrobacter sp.]